MTISSISFRPPGEDRRMRVLVAVLIVNAVLLLIEAVGGTLFHSLALWADAGHMLSDVVALAVALAAQALAGGGTVALANTSPVAGSLPAPAGAGAAPAADGSAPALPAPNASIDISRIDYLYELGASSTGQTEEPRRLPSEISIRANARVCHVICAKSF